MKLQKAALGFLAENLISEQEREKMKQIFLKLDKNLDGSVTKKEMIEGLKKIGHCNVYNEVDRIFAQIDMDGDGEIEFSEWC